MFFVINIVLSIIKIWEAILEYIEYDYSSYNVILFTNHIENKQNKDELLNKIDEMLRDFIIYNKTQIFITGNYDLLKNDEDNFLFIEDNLFKLIFTSGKCQHYIQRNYMRNFIGTIYGNDNYRYICTTERNDLKNFKNSKKFNKIGSDNYYFSPQYNSYLDKYISSLEKKSNSLIKDINNNIINDNYYYSFSDIKNIFTYIAYPLYIKSSYVLNQINYNINKSYNLIEKDLDLDNSELIELKSLIGDKNSEYYYYLIESYITQQMMFIQKEFKYNYIYFFNVNNIPLSENVIFYYDDEKNVFNVGLNSEHCYFLFNEKTVIAFSIDKFEDDKINTINKNINSYLNDSIIANSHDFLITKDELPEKILTHKDDYKFFDMSNIIKQNSNFIRFKNNKIKNLELKNNDSLPLLLSKITENNDFLYIHENENILARHKITIDGKVYYTDKNNIELLNKYKNILHECKIFKNNSNLIFNHGNKYYGDTNNYDIPTKLAFPTTKEIKRIVFSKYDKKIGTPIFLNISNNHTLVIFMDLETLNDFNKYFSKYVTDFNNKKKSVFLDYFMYDKLIFIKYNNDTTRIIHEC